MTSFININLKVLLLFFLLAPLACAQVPVDKPSVENQAFDNKISSLLSFSVPLITVDQLQKETEKVHLFDTRKKEEYEVSHIKGAQYLGYSDFDIARLGDLPKDSKIVVYCSIGYRSEKIGEKLMAKGYTNVHNLYGSLFEWANQNYPFVNSSGIPTKKIHTYNKRWGKWVDAEGLEKVW